MSKLEPQSICNLLIGRKNRYSQLLERARRLRRLDIWVASLLPASARDHCRVANCSADTLTLAVDSPAWSSRMRFQAPPLLRQLNRRHGLGLNRIRVVVQDPASAPPPRTRPARLSTRGAQLLREAADTVGDEALATALRHLANRGPRSPR
ncbi:MAG: DUF721 domain-containing protein [Gammaproteobacteria bacterium]|nr:DUF721 domain-containing protein [Gammaproteobacteria bacterium]NIR98327.1 DUF721 domain-containing protein [Gammaproteobacteria bacterium]NIT64074.1 DUF721 domain-containing protein [Gammaproteobacteria bacterium]NIV21005.1 DUF721 domain-containing protein [Gammaproteobacteria bacterium]NIX10402.1 DUF721 domain-containing protein [Gammaproteobacteria bacterium]